MQVTLAHKSSGQQVEESIHSRSWGFLICIMGIISHFRTAVGRIRWEMETFCHCACHILPLPSCVWCHPITILKGFYLFKTSHSCERICICCSILTLPRSRVSPFLSWIYGIFLDLITVLPVWSASNSSPFLGWWKMQVWIWLLAWPFHWLSITLRKTSTLSPKVPWTLLHQNTSCPGLWHHLPPISTVCICF